MSDLIASLSPNGVGTRLFSQISCNKLPWLQGMFSGADAGHCIRWIDFDVSQMKTFCGPLPEGVQVCAEKPVLLLDWPDDTEVKQFENKRELLHFLATNKRADMSPDFRAYEFVGEEWIEVPIGVSQTQAAPLGGCNEL